MRWAQYGHRGRTAHVVLWRPSVGVTSGVTIGSERLLGRSREDACPDNAGSSRACSPSRFTARDVFSGFEAVLNAEVGSSSPQPAATASRTIRPGNRRASRAYGPRLKELSPGRDATRPSVNGNQEETEHRNQVVVIAERLAPEEEDRERRQGHREQVSQQPER